MPGLANVVQQSTDYEIFKFMGANREQNRGHVEALKKAFEEVGNLTKVQPILVNEHYQIIDGQHRFIACKELEEPIYFTMVNGLGVNEARSMNILHRGWTTDDYARSYAESGNPQYVKYVQLKDEFDFSHSTILSYTLNNRSGAAAGTPGFRAFREGNLVIEDFEGAKARLNKLSEVSEITRLAYTRPFSVALLVVMKSENYNHRRMLSKLRTFGDRHLKKYSAIEDNIRMLEEIYNMGQQEQYRSRLY